MGTRALTFVYDGDKPFVNMYQHLDGYPEGHGIELSKFLMSGELVNGYSIKNKKQFNGMGCLAAQMIAEFKDGPGGFYIYPVGATHCGQEYEYHVYENKVVLKHRDEVIFEGTWPEFAEFCNEPASTDLPRNKPVLSVV